MPRDPYAALQEVCDRASFVAFLEALASDRTDEVGKERQTPSSPYGPGANGWENGTIDEFLSAAAAWARDIEKVRDVARSMTGGEIGPWRQCAEILYAGKGYE